MKLRSTTLTTLCLCMKLEIAQTYRSQLPQKHSREKRQTNDYFYSPQHEYRASEHYIFIIQQLGNLSKILTHSFSFLDESAPSLNLHLSVMPSLYR